MILSKIGSIYSLRLFKYDQRQPFALIHILSLVFSSYFCGFCIFAHAERKKTNDISWYLTKNSTQKLSWLKIMCPKYAYMSLMPFTSWINQTLKRRYFVSHAIFCRILLEKRNQNFDEHPDRFFPFCVHIKAYDDDFICFFICMDSIFMFEIKAVAIYR